MTGRPYTQTELSFYAILGSKARLSDLAAVTGRSEDAIEQAMRYHAIPRRCKGQRPLALGAVKRAWKLHCEGQPIPRTLRFWPQQAGRPKANHRRVWTAGDVDYLSEWIGMKPLRTIALELRRSLGAIVVMARRQRLIDKAYENNCSRLAKRLGLDPSCVQKYCIAGKLDSWVEGGWRIIPRDQAEWLLDNWRWAETPWDADDLKDLRHK